MKIELQFSGELLTILPIYPGRELAGCGRESYSLSEHRYFEVHLACNSEANAWGAIRSTSGRLRTA